MKKSLKILALAAILGVIAWLGAARTADALFTCEFLQNRTCSPEGSTTTCKWSDTPFTGTCTCTSGHWACG